MVTESSIPLFPDDDDGWGPELLREMKQAEQQALIEWAEKLPTRTIRLG
jgi:hypothetical protein